MRCCKVIAVYFGARKQYSDGDEIIELLKYTLANERRVDPGIPMDVVFVNNSGENYKPGYDYLNSIQGEEVFNGHVGVIHRENIGISFGAYNAAFEVLTGEYDYWCFVEDDYIITYHNYFKIAIEQLEANHKLGFVALQGTTGTHPKHAHGGIGIVKNSTLQLVYDKFGCLPHSPTGGERTVKSWDRHIKKGEVAFTSCYKDLNLKLADISSSGSLPYSRWRQEHVVNDLQWWGESRWVYPTPGKLTEKTADKWRLKNKKKKKRRQRKKK